MRTKILLTLLLGVVFAAGVAAERLFFHQEKKLELHLKFDRPSGSVTAYTFYRDAEGREVKHGESYEFDVGGRFDVRGRFEDGKEIGGRARFN